MTQLSIEGPTGLVGVVWVYMVPSEGLGALWSPIEEMEGEIVVPPELRQVAEVLREVADNIEEHAESLSKGGGIG